MRPVVDVHTHLVPKGWPDLAAGPSVALVVIIIYSIWSSLGYSIVVYLAGLTAIPRDLTDAARRACARTSAAACPSPLPIW